MIDLCAKIQPKNLQIHSMTQASGMEKFETFYSYKKVKPNKYNSVSSISTVVVFLKLTEGREVAFLDIRGQEKSFSVDR